MACTAASPCPGERSYLIGEKSSMKCTCLGSLVVRDAGEAAWHAHLWQDSFLGLAVLANWAGMAV